MRVLREVYMYKSRKNYPAVTSFLINLFSQNIMFIFSSESNSWFFSDEKCYVRQKGELVLLTYFSLQVVLH